MTLGELKEDLRKLGIRQVGVLRIRALPSSNGSDHTVVYCSSDEKIVVPFAPKTIYPLVVNSVTDDEFINIEKIKAIKRYFLPDWDEE